MPSDRLLHAVVAGLAGWTLLANGTVFFGGSLDALLTMAAIALIAGIGFARHLRSREASTAEFPEPAIAAESDAPRWLRLAVAASAGGLAAAFAVTRDLPPIWLGAVATVAATAVWQWTREGGTPPMGAPSPASAGDSARLWALAVAGAAIPLFLHRPDLDDAFYLGVAVAAADHPGAALLASDPLHGIPGAPFVPSFYKLHSIELLVAAFARLSPLRALDVAHVLLPAAGGALVVLAHARLLRLLVPGRWWQATATVIVLLLFLGETHQSYGSFSFVRLHQGKGILLAAWVPLLVAFGLEFAARPTWRRWARLFGAQTAAMGLSSTALWLAPAAVALAVASASRPTVRGLRTVALGVVSSVYVVACALAIRSSTQARIESLGDEATQLADAGLALSIVLGAGWVAPLWLAVLVGGWAVARSPSHRALTSPYTLGFLLLVWNPFTAEFVAAQLVGYPTYWRVFWLLPLPALMAATLTWPLEAIRPSLAASAVTVALLLGVGVWAPSHPTWSAQNWARVALPGWKVPEAEMRAARLLAAHAPAGSAVLAPLTVGPWIPTLHGHPAPLVVRPGYLALLRGTVDDAVLHQRLELAALASGRGDLIASTLLAGIQSFDLQAVCLTEQAADGRDIRVALEQASFDRVEQTPGFEVWARRQR